MYIYMYLYMYVYIYIYKYTCILHIYTCKTGGIYYRHLGFDVLPGSGVIRVVYPGLGLVVEVGGGVKVVVRVRAEEPPRDRLVLEPNGAGRLIFKIHLACR